ncbi:MAG: flagellar biosynthesis protein FlhF [Clostridiales bacterium]|nr:flagellar biosynthesis protein FlhF [Clostridiales bacterium]
MTINKYQGKTKEEAIEKAKQELGQEAVVLNVKEMKQTGFFKFLKSTVFEVTAAKEEKESFPAPPAASAPQGIKEKINLAADEEIAIPILAKEKAESAQKPEMGKVDLMRETKIETASEELEKRLESLSNILEKQLSVGEKRKEEKEEPWAVNPEGFQFVKMLYRTLLANEVNEKYVNQIMEEAEKLLLGGSSVDLILSNIYQKMILKFGQPMPIDCSGKKPKIIFCIGPTGVGKTTTIAKIASKCKVEMGKSIAFLTADTYRIAAPEQLRVYANILNAPMSIIYTAEEMNGAIEKMGDYDFVFVDTAGFSHKNSKQCEDMKKLLEGLGEGYEREIYLVISATTKQRDLFEIVDTYKEIADYKLIFTKLDETSTYGNILNAKLYSGAALSYMTTGQNVPDDMEVFDTQKIVKQLLGGR